MSDETPKVKKTFHLPNQPPRDTPIYPDTMGAMKKHPLHMSLDELIDYRATGVKPKYIIDDTLLFQLGKIGASLKTVAQMLSVAENTITENPAFLSAWQNGRSELASKNRAKIAEKANIALKQVAEQKKLDIIVQDPPYANSKIDVTDDIIKVLNSLK